MNNGQVNPPNVVFDNGSVQWVRAENGGWYARCVIQGQLVYFLPYMVRAIYAAMPSELKDGDDATTD